MRSAKTVVVSGAGSGIGRAVAGRLVTDGFHVTAVGRRNEPLDQLASELGAEVDPLPPTCPPRREPRPSPLRSCWLARPAQEW